jgi:hypothetical protein
VDTPPVDTMGKDVMFGKPDNPINNVARPSWEFAWPYKDMNKDSYIIHFSFNLIKKDTKDHLIFYFYNPFIYDNGNIYMSNRQNSPISYDEYFKTTFDINTFFTELAELLIYLQLLKKKIELNNNNIDNIYNYLGPIRTRIQHLFNFNLDLEGIKDLFHHNMTDSNKTTPFLMTMWSKKTTPSSKTCRLEYEFTINYINADPNEVSMSDIKSNLGLKDEVEFTKASFYNRINEKFNVEYGAIDKTLISK